MAKIHYYIATAIICSITTTQAGVIVGGTRVIYEGDQKETSINIRNPDSYSYLIQSWSDAGEKSPDKSPFMVTPPLFRLGAEQENALRIIRTSGNLPEDRESLYWMNIKSIPASEKKDNVNTLQIAVKTRIKIIFRPQALTGRPETQAGKLSWQRSGNSLIVNNPTPYYMNFSLVKAGGLMVKDATYVAPMSTATFTLPASGNSTLTWTIINDYGTASKEFRTSL